MLPFTDWDKTVSRSIIIIKSYLSHSVAKDIEKEEVFLLGKSNRNVGEHILNKEIIKEIYVPGRLINFVVK